MVQEPSILWLRNDLRMSDNAALAAAIQAGAPIVPVFIDDVAAQQSWSAGGASKWWLYEALKHFEHDWRTRGGRLVLRQGDSLGQLRALVQESGATRVFWNRRYESPLRELDASIQHQLHADGIEVQTFNSALLNEPHEIATGAGLPYKVYTPYFRTVEKRPLPSLVTPDLMAMRFPKAYPQSVPLAAFECSAELRPENQLAAHWQPSEAAAQQRLQHFIDKAVDAYDVNRDRPDLEGTSSLSPYLHFGHIGPRQVVHALKHNCDISADGPYTYFKEIYWREFAYHVLYHFPQTPDQPLQPQYQDFPWQNSDENLSRWQLGQTGYPIIDAGMRQLRQTGWMHNRVRMIVASFLVKHLLVSWQAGAKWFWDTLVDADLACNNLGWQWSAGCGADAAPYFRIFNPLLQGRKFDPLGDYVRHYVPELAQVPVRYIHSPWEASKPALGAAGVVLGENYPKPLIEHAEGRARALAAFKRFRNPGQAA